ncbi:hypothetical protein [Leptospira bandrabouensis]|uniref:hypothetical protein n=1 Tax=Leptospira bandrabouensis TaxID=2484903 RepID=UPI001EEAD33C|nr:hypothetical protein [Leptospira bandrabouensis]MCG6154111.1 hypothetical protein [Leptospira bandrabouensis]
MYHEIEKKIARNRLLPKAIKDLTINRNNSYILDIENVRTTYLWAFQYLQENNFRLTRELTQKDIYFTIDEWTKIHRQTFDAKDPRQLKILYLCGPLPSNDFEIFREHGILGRNVYALESREKEFNNAIEDLNSKNYFINIIHEELSKFLKTNNIKFDLIYYDACGSFCTGKPDTLNPIIEILTEERLSDISALITNFSEVKESNEFHSGLIASYYLGRYNDLPSSFWDLNADPAILAFEPENLKKIVKDNFEIFYSDFISRFISDSARYLIPNSRAISFNHLEAEILDRIKMNAKISRAFKDYEITVDNSDDDYLSSIIRQIDDWDLNPGGYPLYTFLKNIPKLTNEKSFFDRFNNIKINNKALKDLIPTISILNALIEGHQDTINHDFLKTIYGSWFDNAGGVFCDVPLPNLAINSYLGKYGRPNHINTIKSDRISYKAKENRMFTDYFLLDNCSEFYNHFPVIKQGLHFFSDIRNQILIRSMIDRIGRYDWASTSHPYRGSALAGFYEIPIAKSYEIPDRDYIN